MGTGVGEAMLIGAATGAGTSALTGSDPLKGAMFGALGGGVGSGIGGALAGSGSGAAAGSTAGSVAGSAAPTAASMAANPALSYGANSAAGITAAAPPTSFMNVFKGTDGTLGSRLGNYMVQNPNTTAMAGAGLSNMMFNQPQFNLPTSKYDGPLSKFRYDPNEYRPAFAGGGITDLDVSRQGFSSGSPVMLMAGGGISDLGSYSDGGRLLRGPGDGMSDDIPASIEDKQPARLADAEFVVPADVVSHLGNGSTDAGARALYDMMDQVRKARTGRTQQAPEIDPNKYLPT